VTGHRQAGRRKVPARLPVFFGLHLSGGPLRHQSHPSPDRSVKSIYPAVRCLSERNFGGHLGDRPGFTTPIGLCSFSCADKKTNQKKPPAPRGPSGCPALLAADGPCGTRLRSNSHRAFIAGCCDARPGTTGHKPPAASGDGNTVVVFEKPHTCGDWELSSLKGPISALRRISKSLRRT